MNPFARKPEETVADWEARLERVDPAGLTAAEQAAHAECLWAARNQLQEQERWEQTLLKEAGAG